MGLVKSKDDFLSIKDKTRQVKDLFSIPDLKGNSIDAKIRKEIKKKN